MEDMKADGNNSDGISNKMYIKEEEWPWHFTVFMQETLMANEKVAIVGNCDTLGNWQLDDCVIMSKGNVKNELNTRKNANIMDDGM